MSDTVASVLRHKGDDVWSVTRKIRVFEAIRLMADKGVGALVVIADDSLVGIISERDYARKVILQGRSSREAKVKDIMTSPVFSVGPDYTVDDCMRIVTTKRIRHLPVVQGEKLIGVVSIGDLVRRVISTQGETIQYLQSTSSEGPRYECASALDAGFLRTHAACRGADAERGARLACRQPRRPSSRVHRRSHPGAIARHGDRQTAGPRSAARRRWPVDHDVPARHRVQHRPSHQEPSPGTRIVAGGYDPSLAPQAYEDCREVDFIVRGEGEETLSALVRALETNDSIQRIAGLTYRTGGGLVATPIGR